VLEVGQRSTSERGSWIAITDRTGGRMSFDRHYAPRTGKADPHYHLDFTQTGEAQYAEAWAHHMREGTVNEQDEIPLLQILVIARATDGQSYTSRCPRGFRSSPCP
jgi:hypothetical protein